MMNDRYELFNKLCLRHVPLSEQSSYGIGGLADYFALPATVEQLVTILEVSSLYGMERVVFGMGSNILFPDQPKQGTLYISLKNMANISVDESSWFLTSGLPLSMLSLVGLLTGSSAFQFTYLMPGSFGAGIYMNAKYYKEQVGDKVATISYIDLTDPALAVRQIRAEDCEFAYKQSIFQHKPWIIVGAEITVPEQDGMNFHVDGISRLLTHYKDSNGKLSSLFSFYSFFSSELRELQRGRRRIDIPEPMLDIDQYRTGNRHFTYRSCGSFFKNNYAAGSSIGALVDRLGLKGVAHGGGIISPYHGNMILNAANATAADILYLKDMVSEAIHQRYGFIPEPEVVIMKE
ncbi:UDP-N-acetylmuramate dehydrogenase [Paenibacillus radicis (ex Gao et al. 2016)]|uniref:UDP-N-acetylenolpyruvoylglucosamine reductase n=1 Tax=Paenibacillus radicis (ex Gao et al. 2016) TaxID=1737354 RepID=A0A917M084_9BACL|nr:UDP-N-acetylmuramate dehydrogenase [Paenibacillus radicis (ex Gao et al. 2016)]GGG69415.1 UDP-N-acetylenolpyruvoylglucosamine reductase [Paenibacillus radicis (ex Gao et al. 2016)]